MSTPTVIIDAHLTLGGNDMSDHVKSCKITMQGDTKDVTTMSAAGWKAHAAGLKGGTLDIEFVDDFNASQVDALIWSMFNTSQTFAYRKDNTNGVGAANPQYTGSVIVDKTEVGAAVGEVAAKSLSLPITGAVARAVS